MSRRCPRASARRSTWPRDEGASMIGAVLLALLPIILLIALGVVLRKRHFLAENFWPQAERLGYFLLLPALFLHGLATAQLGALPVRELAGTLVLSILIVAAL